MNTESRVNLRWTVLVGMAAGLLALGAGATFVAMRSGAPAPEVAESGTPAPTGPAADPAALAAPADAAATLPDVVVPVSETAVERAGIKLVTVSAATSSAGGLRAPGVIAPNAYRAVVVTPLVSGRVTSVTAELGQRVLQGQTIAQVFSPELASAQTEHISNRANLEAHEREVARTETLVRIGAASREELERVHAAHAMHLAEVQLSASTLELLGLPPSAIESLGPGKPIASVTDVPAPITGVVTERMANVGLNVDQASSLFTVVDLSSVWVVAELYEKDFALVRIGTPATVTTSAYPDLVIQGRVSYVDPQVAPETRAAKVRVEVPNARQALRLGMYVDVLFGGSERGSTPMVPRGAIQHVGDRTVVYLVDSRQPGVFVEREVRLASAVGDQMAVLEGVMAGDVVVAEGSFFVRAERERLGLRQSPRPVNAPGPSSESREPQAGSSVQNARIVVGAKGFDPATVTVRAGVEVRLTFVRTTDETCATEVVFPSLDVRRALPLNEPTVVSFTPSQAGEVAWACGMNMFRGAVVVR